MKVVNVSKHNIHTSVGKIPPGEEFDIPQKEAVSMKQWLSKPIVDESPVSEPTKDE